MEVVDGRERTDYDILQGAAGVGVAHGVAVLQTVVEEAGETDVDSGEELVQVV